MFESTQTFLAMGLSLLVVLFTIGLLFFFLRSEIMDFVQEIPGPLLDTFRSFLIYRQSGRLQRLEERRILTLLQVTVAKWAQEGFQMPTYLPPQARFVSSEEAIHASERCWKLIWGQPSGIELHFGAGEHESLLLDFESLYIGLARPETSQACAAEQLRWNKHPISTDVRKLFVALEGHASRKYLPIFMRLQGFPESRWLKPTVLGNELAALDSYADRRYGLDTSSLWIRIQQIIPLEAKKTVEDARLNVETSLNLATAVAVLTIMVATSAVVNSWRALQKRPVEVDWQTVAVLCVFVILVRGFYGAAVFSARNFREKIIGLIDIYALALVQKMGFRPKTVQELQDLYTHLNEFFLTASKLPGNLALHAVEVATPKASAN